MKKTKKNNKTIKIVAATSLSIFTLLSVFAATMAWFAMNDNTNGDGMMITTKRLSGRLQSVYVHSFNSENSSSSSFSFNKTPIASYDYNWETQTMVPDANNPSTWDMGDFTSLDRDHPLLMVFAFDKDYVSENGGDMFIRGVTTVGGDNLSTTFVNGVATETTGGGFLGARNDTGGPFYTLPQEDVNDAEHPERILMKKVPYTEGGKQKYRDYYALSSVAKFSSKTFSNSEYETLSSGSYLTFATNSLEKGESFTTINNATDKYVFNQNPYLFKSHGTETVKYVALIIEYNQDAINYIYSTYLGDSGLNQYDSIFHFSCDWSLEVE